MRTWRLLACLRRASAWFSTGSPGSLALLTASRKPRGGHSGSSAGRQSPARAVWRLVYTAGFLVLPRLLPQLGHTFPPGWINFLFSLGSSEPHGPPLVSQNCRFLGQRPPPSARAFSSSPVPCQGLPPLPAERGCPAPTQLHAGLRPLGDRDSCRAAWRPVRDVVAALRDLTLAGMQSEGDSVTFTPGLES